MCQQKRLLNDIRGVNPDAQPAIELPLRPCLEIASAIVQQPPSAPSSPERLRRIRRSFLFLAGVSRLKHCKALHSDRVARLALLRHGSTILSVQLPAKSNANSGNSRTHEDIIPRAKRGKRDRRDCDFGGPEESTFPPRGNPPNGISDFP